MTSAKEANPSTSFQGGFPQALRRALSELFREGIDGPGKLHICVEHLLDLLHRVHDRGVVFVGENHGMGIAPSETVDKVVQYSGKQVTIVS